MVNALAPWGIDPRAEELYRSMLRMPTVTPQEFVEKHGWDRDDLDSSVRALVRARLVKLDVDGKPTVVPPITALDELVISEETRLASRAKQLDEARRALRLYASEYRVESASELPVAELVSFGQWDDQMLHSLIAAANGGIRIVYSDMLPDAAPRIAQLKRVVGLGYPLQILIPAIYIGEPSVIEAMKTLSTANAEIRLGSDAKSSFAVYGTLAASIVTNPDDFRCDRLVVRIPTIINILTSYFEAVWNTSIPVTDESTTDDARIIALLGEGLKDETIARNLGLSLRTVRRRIADFMDEIGAETRFQAGAEAQRRGMV